MELIKSLQNLVDAFKSFSEATDKLNEVLQELDLPDYTIQENLAAESILNHSLSS